MRLKLSKRTTWSRKESAGQGGLLSPKNGVRKWEEFQLILSIEDGRDVEGNQRLKRKPVGGDVDKKLVCRGRTAKRPVVAAIKLASMVSALFRDSP